MLNRKLNFTMQKKIHQRVSSSGISEWDESSKSVKEFLLQFWLFSVLIRYESYQCITDWCDTSVMGRWNVLFSKTLSNFHFKQPQEKLHIEKQRTSWAKYHFYHESTIHFSSLLNEWEMNFVYAQIRCMHMQ